MEEVDVIYKDLDLYLAAKNGNLDHFAAIIHRVSATQNASFGEIMGRLSPAGNTFLHVAAQHGHKYLVAYILSREPNTVFLKNFKGETALHAVAKAGDAPTAKELLQIGRSLVPAEQNDTLLRAETNRGNTALHEAISNGRSSIAEYLIEQDPELLYCMNKSGESALYLAAKAGYESLVRLILRSSTDEERVDGLFIGERSPVQAAIKWRHMGVLEAIYDAKPRLIQSRDGEGRNPLHYAASLGHFQEAHFLHNKCKHNAIQRDKSGSFPIHLATINEFLKLIHYLLRDFPDPGELLDRDGCSILHLAAKNGIYDIVRFVLKDPRLEAYINMQDNEGNTALHLAIRNNYPRIVLDLAWDKRVNIKVSNDQGMTAIDVVDEAYKLGVSYLPLIIGRQLGFHKFSLLFEEKKKSDKNFKEKTKNLLVIAVLIATVTFAAGFTVPGGYESSKNPGMATLWKEKRFIVFVLCDSIAMYASVAASVALICSPAPSYTVNYFATQLLVIALTMMSMAFTAGVLVVLPTLWWLTSAIWTMNAAFNVLLVLLFLPQHIPITYSTFQVFRRQLYHIFRWFIYLNEH